MDILAFEVSPGDDDAFLAEWDRAGAGGTLLCALRDDVEFRYVGLGEAPAGLAHPVHGGRYEPVHSDGEPFGSEGTTLVNPFEVPTGEDERFLAGWGGARDALADQPGYLGTRLHRSVDDGAEFRFVNVARWSSPLMFQRAMSSPGFQAAAAGIDHQGHPALYRVVR